MFSAGQSTISTTIDVEPTTWVDVPQQPPQQPTNNNTTENPGNEENVTAEEKPLGPKPAKVVDAQAINLSAFLHFAPKSAAPTKGEG